MLRMSLRGNIVTVAISCLLFVLVACGDDDGDFATRPSDDSSSSVCEDCDDESSSSVTSKSSSSSKVPDKVGEPVEPAEGSSSSTKSSSSSAKSSSSTKSSSSLAMYSSSVTQQSSSSETSVSSSSTESSSSSAKSSSSATLATPCKTETEDNCEYGELVDDRDGQTYKTVKIGLQTWMAENLNFEMDSCFCYKNVESNCTKYGRLYTWAAAMDSAGTWTTNGKGCGYYKTCSPTYPVRGVCPSGWHLPTQTEWNTLFTAVGGSSTAGTKLKSTSGWNSSGNGTDAFGFSALPAGRRDDVGDFYSEGNYALFWSSTESDSYYAFLRSLAYDRDRANLSLNDKYGGFSVRCLQD